MNQSVKYNSQGTASLGAFIHNVAAAQKEAPGTAAAALLDSVKNDPGQTLPKAFDDLMGNVADKDGIRILDSVARGVQIYQAEHGTLPTGDLLEAALQQGFSAFKMIGENGRPLLDAVSNSASSGHSDPGSLQPNRAVVAILSTMAEAIPFASYLPVDIASNQAKLAILTHIASSTYGDYVAGGIMDGVAGGMVYASSSRKANIDHSGATPYNTKITQTNLPGTVGRCDPNGTGVPVLRGRTIVYVMGQVAAIDAVSGSGATSALSGTVTTVDPANGYAPITYTIAGTVTLATGAISLTSVTPDFTVGTSVYVESIVDYETSPALIPSVGVRADTYDIFANPWRVMTSATIDTVTQMRNELGLDANSEAIMAMRSQMSAERHYNALDKVYELGQGNKASFDFAFATRSPQLVRAQIFQDLQAELAVVDQVMAERTLDHGITHIYVSKFMAGIMQTLPGDMFQSSGIAARPGIYRVGRLFGKYEVYFSPRVAVETNSTSTMVCVGRASNVAQCPIVLGDAVSPTFLDLNMQSDLKRQSAIYARDFTVVNPHAPSALGCAVITVTNLR